MSDIAKLKEITLFAGLSDAMLEEFSGYFKQSAFAAGRTVFGEKTTGDSLYIIVDGEVVIEKAMDEEGREFKTLAILSGGDFFGEMAVLGNAVRFAQARASKDSVLFEIGRDRFFSFIKERPETGIKIFSEILKTVSRRLQHTSSELTMLFDLSRQLMAEHRSPGEFLAKVMDEMHIYLEGSWNIVAYAYNKFNEEYEQVYSHKGFQGPAPALPAKAESGWLDARTYLMVSAAEGHSLGCVTYTHSDELSPVEKNNLATIFNTISSILGSAMLNIEHQTEAAMMERMRKTKNSI
ncbi:MAG: cyclic nucleotide-binding domain-containing protein [Elusimicrobia bacterium]|nr:cyclic nucleotide-binding domain-containing protein [Elusimicrobiota bacterium]